MTGILPTIIIPEPTRIIVALFDLAVSGVLFDLTAYSLLNVLSGLLLSIVVGIGIGFALGLYGKRLHRYVLPFFRICEKLNPFALFSVFILLFGIGREEKVAIVFWVSVWPMLFATLDATRNLDGDMIRSALSIGASGRKLFTKVIFPMTMPSIITGVKSSAQLAFFMLVASETMAATNWLGLYFMQMSRSYNLPLVYGLIIFITLLAISINIVFTLIDKHFSTWRPSVFND
jgi:NitT/TauT family transport system permease protein